MNRAANSNKHDRFVFWGAIAADHPSVGLLEPGYEYSASALRGLTSGTFVTLVLGRNDYMSAEAFGLGNTDDFIWRSADPRPAAENDVRAFVGQWVALSGNKVIAAGKDAADVARRVREMGERPFLLFVEDIPESAARLGL